MDTHLISNSSGATVSTSSEASIFQVTLAPSNQPDSEELKQALKRLETLRTVQYLLREEKRLKGLLEKALLKEKRWNEDAQNRLEWEEERKEIIQKCFESRNVEKGLGLDLIKSAIIKKERMSEKLIQKMIQIPLGPLEIVRLHLQKLQSAFEKMDKLTSEAEKVFKEWIEELSQALATCQERLKSIQDPMSWEKYKARKFLLDDEKRIKEKLKQVQKEELLFKKQIMPPIPMRLEELYPQFEIFRSNILRIIKAPGVLPSKSELPQDLAHVIASLLAGEFGDFTVEKIKQDELSDGEAGLSEKSEKESEGAKSLSPEVVNKTGENLAGFGGEREAFQKQKNTVYLVKASAPEQKTIQLIIPVVRSQAVTKK